MPFLQLVMTRLWSEEAAPESTFLRSERNAMGASQKVFISYSHYDEQWLNKLNLFLRPLERDAGLELWSDKKIHTSSDWHADIQAAITDADAAILLISQHFLSSDYVASDELPELLASAGERGLKIFPVIVSASHFRKGSLLLDFQAANSPSRPLDSLDEPEQNRILANLAGEIEELLTIASTGVTDEWLEKFRSRFVPIEGGACLLGDDELAAKTHALTEHEVHVEAFRLGKYTVTQAEWTAIMNTRPWSRERNVKYGNDIPATYVSWFDAGDFVRVINKVDSAYMYRLPSEEEWEYAARGGTRVAGTTRTKFAFGDDVDLLVNYGWYDQNASLRGQSYPHPVGELAPNQVGLYDMHGNVWEWTADNVEGLRSLRGGGFNFYAEGAGSAFRVLQKPEMKGDAAGFRLVQERRPR